MKPTKEQLKDPKWWNESAPKGADAWVDGSWIKWVDGVEFGMANGRCDWYKTFSQFSLGDYEKSVGFKVYTRPEPEQEPEWQPKVGDVCLARAFGDDWREAELLKYTPDGYSVFYESVNGSQFVFLSKDFKPILTKKDEFVKAAQKTIERDGEIDLAALYDLAMEFK